MIARMERKMEKPRILFVSWHFYMDVSNGASISARELLRALHYRGWNVRTFCGPAVDNSQVSNVCDALTAHGIVARERVRDVGVAPFSIDSFQDVDGFQSFVYRPANCEPIPQRLSGEVFMRFANRILKSFRPGIVVTYGGYWLAPKILSTIRRSGAKSVFLLQNFAYKEKSIFDHVDLTIVPSEYSARVYRERLGIESTVLPPIIRSDEFEQLRTSDKSDQRYVLYVNPSLNKGVFLFAKIARDLAGVRPDIPILVVEGGATSRDLLATSFDARTAKNVYVMRNAPGSCSFYRRAKLTLVPSFFDESFGRVAAESMLCGIPIIASDRGALPETVGKAGSLISIPRRYTPHTREVPLSEEAKPWVDEIVKLWDNADYYALRREQALHRAFAWNYSKVVERYEQVLRKLLSV